MAHTILRKLPAITGCHLIGVSLEDDFTVYGDSYINAPLYPHKVSKGHLQSFMTLKMHLISCANRWRWIKATGMKSYTARQDECKYHSGASYTFRFFTIFMNIFYTNILFSYFILKNASEQWPKFFIFISKSQKNVKSFQNKMFITIYTQVFRYQDRWVQCYSWYLWPSG